MPVDTIEPVAVRLLRAFPFAGVMMGGKAASSFSLRYGRPEDVEAILDLWRQSDATPSATDNAEDLRRALAASAAHVLVAVVKTQIIGSIIGTFDGWRGNIYRLVVHPGYRRNGVARALVAEVEKRLAERGAKRITALVEKDHPMAMNFWEAVGYRVDERLVRRVRTLETGLVKMEPLHDEHRPA